MAAETPEYRHVACVARAVSSQITSARWPNPQSSRAKRSLDAGLTETPIKQIVFGLLRHLQSQKLSGLEAGAGIEPANSGFADRDLTTWLPRHLRGDASIQHTGKVSMLSRDLRKVDRDP
jgi:hypothetical protein